MGANHPKEIEFLCNIAKPDFGYITNFGKAHLEGFGNLEGVIKAKTELYQYLKINNKIVFVNANDNTQIEKSINMQVISFGTEKSKYSIKLLSANPFVTMEFDNIIIESNMLGIYNYNNIAAAIAIGKHFNVNNNQIKQALEIYHPTNNRSQIINLEDKKIILDAYNANPSSMKSALENFIQLTDKNKIVILGDMFELGSYTEIEHQKITDFFNNNNFKHIYLLGGNFLKTTTNNKNITILKNYNSFEEHFDIVKFKNSTILIKASRGMALERIVNLLK
ncbi:MAG TPA: UDP-N-acetylmuramoyl-tripeptide--D-alanyl-D-alanine ligase, partial [Flavobacteriaceae bacterium]|nr:UDP-N-acetylmuramoyl-tripeptide--D-alanyl-D-alanine ligase [Flavobacteriaceae bacterium]